MDENEDFFEGFDYYDFSPSNQPKRQRFWRKGILDRLPTPLKQYLYACPIVYLPRRYDSRLLDSMKISPIGIGHLEKKKKSYQYYKFANRQGMIEAAQELSDKHDDKEVQVWMGAGPFLVVPLGWVRHHLAELLQASYGEMCLLTKDLKVGLVMTQEDGHCHKIPATGNICYVPRKGEKVAVPWVLGVWGY